MEDLSDELDSLDDVVSPDFFSDEVVVSVSDVAESPGFPEELPLKWSPSKPNSFFTNTFSISEIIPSAGQAVVALQCKKNNDIITELLQRINHQPTHNCMLAERNVLKVLEGDCETAIGATSSIKNNQIILEAELFSLDGEQRFYHKSSKEIKSAALLGLEVGEILKKESKNSYKK